VQRGARRGFRRGIGLGWARRWSLRARFVLVALACLLPLLGVAFFVLYQSLHHGRSQLLETQVAAAEAVAQAVASNVRTRQRMLEDVASQPMIRRSELAKTDQFLSGVKTNPGNDLYDIFLVGHDGRILASTGALDPALPPPALRAALEPALGPGEFGVSSLIKMPNGDGVVALVQPVEAEDPAAPQAIAAVGALLSANQLAHNVLPFARRGETVIGVVSGDDILATRAGNDELSDEDVRGQLQDAVAAAVAGQIGTVTYEDDTGVERFAAYAPVGAPGAAWAVIVSRPSPTSSGPNQALVERGLAALGLAVVAAVLLAVVLSEWIARPLRQLTAQAVAIARGDFGHRAPPVGGGEVAALSVAFDDMADQLAEQVHDLEAAREAGAAQAEQLRDLLRRTVRLQEDERRRIAGEIHDAVNPLITGALYQARALRLAGTGNGAASADANDRAADLDAIGDLLTRAMEELHDVIFALRPPDLDDLGVVAAIERYVAQITRAGLDSRLEVAGEPPALTPEVRLAVYRIVQEALHNALRHAAADEAVVCLETVDGRLRVTIWDNGAGFDPDHPARPAALGLLGMRERAAAIGASFAVSSRPGDGTSVVIERQLEPAGPAALAAEPNPALPAGSSPPPAAPSSSTAPRATAPPASTPPADPPAVAATTGASPADHVLHPTAALNG